MKNRRHRFKSLKRWSAAIAGVILFGAGAITFPLPIPTGLILMAIGISLMTMNPLMLRWLRKKRSGNPKIDQFVGNVIPHTPSFLRRALQRTGRQRKKSNGPHHAQ